MAQSTTSRTELAIIQSQRRSLFIIGSLFVIFGIGVIWSPYAFFRPAAYMIGLGLITSAAFKALQFLLGKSARGYSFRSSLLILLQVLLDLGLGFVFLTNQNISFRVITLLLGLLFLVDGCVQMVVALRSRGVRARALFFINSLVTLGLGAITIIAIPSLRIEGAAVLLGIRLISFGLVLLSMSIRSRDDTQPVIYREVDTTIIRRRRGELYACYFGGAFHLGVYIGNNEMVHYRDDNIVHRTSWEDFLLGREPQRWIYPDIPTVPEDRVVKTAIAQVGKKSKYSLLTNNCEHFAIYCKTGGKTRHSDYAQTSATIQNLRNRPFVATFVEAYSRIGEWLAFHFGGAFGHRVSSRIRRFNSMVTAWMLANR